MLKSTYSMIDYMKKALDGYWLRHNAISSNIANVNTPGYKKITVHFEDVLRQSINNNRISLRTTDERHIAVPNSKNNGVIIKKERNYSSRRDGNNVNIDIENAELAKNTIMYETLIRQISNEFNKIKTVINEGGK